jgi:hypothetical protein
MQVHELFDIITRTVTVCSLIYSLFPPVEAFADYPRFQKGYKFVLIFVLKFASFNFRNVVIPDIKSTANQGGTKTL